MASDAAGPSLEERRAVRKIQTARKDLRTMRGVYLILSVISLAVSIPATLGLMHHPSLPMLLAATDFWVLIATAAMVSRAPGPWAIGLAVYFSAAELVVLVYGGFSIVGVILLLILWGYVPIAWRISRVIREYGGLSVARAGPAID